MDQDFDSKLAQTIGREARKAREARVLTQEDVAERIGISGEFYARIERGNALPSVQTLYGISRVLDVSADLLLGRVKGERATARAAKPGEHPPEDPPPIRRLARRLRKAHPDTIQMVIRVLKELERRRATRD